MIIGLVCVSGESKTWWVVCKNIEPHLAAQSRAGREVIPLQGTYVRSPKDRLCLVGGGDGSDAAFDAFVTFGESSELIMDGVLVEPHDCEDDEEGDSDEFELAGPKRLVPTHQC